jgi:hypothetical protein
VKEHRKLSSTFPGIVGWVIVAFFVQQLVAQEMAPGEVQINGVTAWITAHVAWIVGIGGAILEVAFRLFPSNKIRSFLSYGGRILIAVAKLLYAVSDALSKLVPDRRPGDAPPINTPTK